MSHSPHDAHARFRFSVVGPLLSAPPNKGEIRAALEALAERRVVGDQELLAARARLARANAEAISARAEVSVARAALAALSRPGPIAPGLGGPGWGAGPRGGAGPGPGAEPFEL